MEKAISKSRFNRRLRAIAPPLWQALFDSLAEFFKQGNPEQAYVVDSLPYRSLSATASESAAASSILQKSTAESSAAT
jgi:hypothetical protein